MADDIEDFFMRAGRLQALIHTGVLVCLNCADPVDDEKYEYCGMCREMGCPLTPPPHDDDVGGQCND